MKQTRRAVRTVADALNQLILLHRKCVDNMDAVVLQGDGVDRRVVSDADASDRSAADARNEGLLTGLQLPYDEHRLVRALDEMRRQDEVQTPKKEEGGEE